MKWLRSIAALGCASSALLAACASQRGGEPVPLERRLFHETPPPEMVFATRPDAGEIDAAEPDASKPPPRHPAHKSDGSKAWAAPPSGYLEQLGAEFKRLRPVPLTEYEAGHTKGRKRQVMNELGRLLVMASRDTVIRIMGGPDADARPGSARWGPTAKQDGRAAERLLYQWRGWKDYLLFELDAHGRVLRSEWFLSTL
jgi:hypothetical protein